MQRQQPDLEAAPFQRCDLHFGQSKEYTIHFYLFVFVGQTNGVRSCAFSENSLRFLSSFRSRQTDTPMWSSACDLFVGGFNMVFIRFIVASDKTNTFFSSLCKHNVLTATEETEWKKVERKLNRRRWRWCVYSTACVWQALSANEQKE